MKKAYFSLSIILIALSAGAQSLSPTVISATGGFSSNANGSLSYTVGEMTMVETFTGGNNILTQGFQQPNDFTIGILEISQGEYGSFVVYPNPAVDNLWFGFEFPESGKINVAIYDVLGQKVADIYNSNYQNGKTVETLNVSNYSAGTYMMTLTFSPDNGGKAHLITKRFQVVN